jgi:hypothetical protein
MNATILTTCVLLLAAAPARADDPCASSGHCHLPRVLGPAPAAGNQFGRVLASDGGEYLFVGEPFADRVHVVRRVGVVWQHVETLEGPAGSRFGWSIDADGPRLAVGAPLDDTAVADGGAAYLFQRVGSVHQPTATLVSGVPQTGAAFGDDVAVTVSRAAVGAPTHAGGGRVETFERVAGTWIPHATFTRPGSGALGDALDIEGDSLLVGDWSDDAFGANSGVVHHVRMLAAGLSVAVEVRPQGLAAGDQFGRVLDVDAERLVVGAPGDDDQAANNGAAHVFERTSVFVAPFVEYVELDTLHPCRATPGIAFGSSVAVRGDRIAVGAPSAGAAGTTYTFRRTTLFGETWPVDDEMRPEGGGGGDGFGTAVALAGTTVFVGAPFADDVAANEGAYYIVSTSPDALLEGACPCAGLAGNAPYGNGKPGALGVPVLELVGELVPGESTLVRARNLAPGTLPVLLWGLQPAVLPFDDGFLGMADPNMIAMPAVSAFGQVGYVVDVPPGICNLVVALQVMVLDPIASGPLGTAQSNALYAVIGY